MSTVVYKNLRFYIGTKPLRQESKKQIQLTKIKVLIHYVYSSNNRIIGIKFFFMRKTNAERFRRFDDILLSQKNRNFFSIEACQNASFTAIIFFRVKFTVFRQSLPVQCSMEKPQPA